jgi:PIN domain nuclease of toxin-antitoxin system
LSLLLDTHTLLWFTLGAPQISPAALDLINDAGNDKLVSPVSFGEIAIKVSIGKLALNQPYDNFIERGVRQNGFGILPIEPRHTGRVAVLPFHHKDPFDRLLIAQALTDGIAIVGADPLFDRYGAKRLW